MKSACVLLLGLDLIVTLNSVPTNVLETEFVKMVNVNVTKELLLKELMPTTEVSTVKTAPNVTVSTMVTAASLLEVHATHLQVSAHVLVTTFMMIAL